MTLRLPLELREAVTEEARVEGDLARIVRFALSHVDRKDVEIQQTRKAGLLRRLSAKAGEECLKVGGK